MTKYAPANGSILDETKVNKYGRELEKLAKLHGNLTPKQVLEAAKDTKSSLHNYFEWDDAICGEKWRLEQASYLLRSIVIIDSEHSDGEVRAYFNVKETESGERSYVSLDRVMTEPELRKQIVEYALNEIDIWKDRYHKYSELRPIFKAVKVVEKKVKRKEKKKRK
jgi:hypothetical protein